MTQCSCPDGNNNPPIYLENDFNIDQAIGIIDTCTCQLNSFFNSFVQLLKSLGDLNDINVDMNSFINCTEPQWNIPAYVGMSVADKERFSQNLINHFNGPAGFGLTEEQKIAAINAILATGNTAFRILQWLASGSQNETTETIKSYKDIPINIFCSDSIQEYVSKPPFPCDKSCTITIPVKLIYRSGVTKQKAALYPMSNLIRMLCSGNAISCSLDISQIPGYATNVTSDDLSNEVITIVNSLRPADNLGNSEHAVSCIGFECVGEDYIEFIFKDSYEYGTTIKRPGIFRIRVKKNRRYVPFGVGNPLGTTKATSGFLYVTFPNKIDKSAIKQQILEAKAKCCGVTPTPTPTPTAEPWYPSTTPTPTPTPTPSDIFGTPPSPSASSPVPPPPTPSFSF